MCNLTQRSGSAKFCQAILMAKCYLFNENACVYIYQHCCMYYKHNNLQVSNLEPQLVQARKQTFDILNNGTHQIFGYVFFPFPHTINMQLMTLKTSRQKYGNLSIWKYIVFKSHLLHICLEKTSVWGKEFTDLSLQYLSYHPRKHYNPFHRYRCFLTHLQPKSF